MKKLIAIILGIVLPIIAQANIEDSLANVDKSIRYRNYNQAVTQLQPLLKKNYAEAQYRMAGLYRSGKGVKSDLDKATKLYRKAAISGLPEAQYTLASILEKQGPDQRKPADVLKWYRAAAKQGYSKAIRKLATLEKSDSNSSTANISKKQIFDAIRVNDISQIRSLIKRGVNLDIVDSNKRPALIVSLLAGHRELSKTLLSESTQLNTPDGNGDRPIHLATRNGYGNIVSALIRKKVNINAPDRLGNTALIIATRHDDEEMIKLLLKNKADYRIKNKKNQSAPEIAQTLKLKTARSVFVKYGIKLPSRNKGYAKINLKTFQKTISKSASLYKGWPPLNIASLLGETVIAGQLLDQGANILATDSDGNSALHRAASKGRRDTVKLLITRGSNVDAVNNRNETALYLAATSGQLKTIKLLLMKGADTSIIAKNKTSPLSAAIINGHAQSALALQNGRLDKASIHRALLLAIQGKMEALSTRLIKADRLVSQADSRQRTALWYSADHGLKRVTAALIRNNPATINYVDINGYTPLARAVSRGHMDIAKLLTSHGASVNALTSENNSILMLSVLSGKNEMTEFLLGKNTDINARNHLGDTALMLAATTGSEATVGSLIKAGADLQIRNLDDQNAYQIAISSGHNKSANLIKKHSGLIFRLFN